MTGAAESGWLCRAMPQVVMTKTVAYLYTCLPFHTSGEPVWPSGKALGW